MSSDTAKAVLLNQKLRWSPASFFNDPFDIQFDLHLDYDRDTVIEAAKNDLWDFYSGARDFLPANRLGHAIQWASRSKRNIPRDVFQSGMASALNEGFNNAERNIAAVQQYMREHVSCVKLLCLTEVNDNLLMWSHYAANHTGVVLRLACVEELDSPWGVAQPIVYSRTMPRLLDNESLRQLVTGQSTIDRSQTLHDLVFTKAIDWQYEQEWRTASFESHDANVEDVSFNKKELAGVYFGCRCPKETYEEITMLARKINPEVEIFYGRKSHREFAIEFVKADPMETT
jgi:hypothetical protein